MTRSRSRIARPVTSALALLVLFLTAGCPTTAAAANYRAPTVQPTLDLDLRLGVGADESAVGSEADLLRRRKLGRLELWLGIGTIAGGVIAETVVLIDVAVFNANYTYYADSYGYQYYYYENLAYFPHHGVAIVGAVVGGMAIAGGTALLVGGLIRMARVKREEKQASSHGDWRWGGTATPPRSTTLVGLASR